MSQAMIMDTKPETVEMNHVEGEEFGTRSTATPTNEAVHAGNNNDVVEKDYAVSTNLENGISGDLSPEHRDYLMARHGTTDLIPLPTMDPADPLNWPSWKVRSPTHRPVSQNKFKSRSFNIRDCMSHRWPGYLRVNSVVQQS